MLFGVNKVNRVNSYFAPASLCEVLFTNFVIYVIIIYSSILIIVMGAKITVYLVYLTMAVTAFCGRFKKKKKKAPKNLHSAEKCSIFVSPPKTAPVKG